MKKYKITQNGMLIKTNRNRRVSRHLLYRPICAHSEMRRHLQDIHENIDFQGLILLQKLEKNYENCNGKIFEDKDSSHNELPKFASETNVKKSNENDNDFSFISDDDDSIKTYRKWWHFLICL
ncbi:hypothetical protein PVAND_003660 [Polypedilum vanderplanki]|uniref:Uncharacterized protein n=1 Tax=Polypedilum vanderplanki TaxID=319348 RepID=A0A9J6BUR0_POLVA|nr:hypothetical protein PVAND_003660 [Polypedilum vanderplanki]